MNHNETLKALHDAGLTKHQANHMASICNEYEILQSGIEVMLTRYRHLVALAEAVRAAALKVGIITPEAELNAAHIMMLIGDLADAAAIAYPAVRQDHAAWSESTFGPVGPIGPLKHLSKEALEAAAQPNDLSEWADMQFLFWDAQRRAGISDSQIIKACEEKLVVNKARTWPAPKDGEPRMHIEGKRYRGN